MIKSITNLIALLLLHFSSITIIWRIYSSIGPEKLPFSEKPEETFHESYLVKKEDKIYYYLQGISLLLLYSSSITIRLRIQSSIGTEKSQFSKKTEDYSHESNLVNKIVKSITICNLLPY